ncbi:MAG: tetratricopeptide repeat protein [Chloroflexota bacterium]
MGLTIQVLNEVGFRIDGQPVPQLRSKTASALLIYLAYHPRSFSRAYLSALFWPDKAEAQAGANLRTALKLLRPHFSPYLNITRQQVGFKHGTSYEIDAKRFETNLGNLLDLGDVGSEETTLDQLKQFFDRKVPQFLPGFYIQGAPDFEQWLSQTQRRFQQSVESGLQRYVRVLLKFAQYREGTEIAEELVTINPYLESPRRVLMECLWRSGRRTAALAQYSELTEMLQAEFGTIPEMQTDQLYAKIQAEQVLPPSNLPLQTTPFIGRKYELEDAYKKLLIPSCRLLTIFGPGGVGKTRLLMAIGEKFRATFPGRFPDGVFFVPLAQLTTVKYLATAIATALGLTLSGNDSVESDLLNHFKDQEILLLLDNMEHLLLNEADVDQTLGLIESIVHAAPLSKLCVTSRTRLMLREEWLFPLEGLAVPPNENETNRLSTHPTHVDLVSYPAIKLFLNHSQQRPKLFEPRPDELPVVGHICRLLDGLPLGIEMASALLDEIPCTQIATHIESHLGELSLPLRNVPKRHQSLWGLFDYSYQQLEDRMQGILKRLAIFQAPFSEEGAKAVAFASLSDLRRLVDRALLIERQVSDDQMTRYEMHSLLHRFVQDQLQADPATGSIARERQTNFITSFLYEREADIMRGGPPAIFSEIEASIDDIRAVWGRILGEDRHQGQAEDQFIPLERSLNGLFYFYWTRGWLAEGHEMASKLSALPNNQELSIKGRLWESEFDAWLSKYDASEKGFLETLARCRPLGLRSIEIDALNGLGRVRYWQGELEASERLFVENLRLARVEEDPFAIALALNCLANVVAEARADYDDALVLFSESLSISRQVGDFYGSARALINMGTVANKQEEYEKAAALYQESLDLYQHIGYQHGIGFTLNYMGQLASKTGRYAEAESLITQSFERHQRSGDRRGMADSLRQLGNTARDQNKVETAFDHYKEALTLARSFQGELLTLSILVELAQLFMQIGQEQRATIIALFVKAHSLAGQEVIEPAELLLQEISAAGTNIHKEMINDLSQADVIAFALASPPFKT